MSSFLSYSIFWLIPIWSIKDHRVYLFAWASNTHSRGSSRWVTLSYSSGCLWLYTDGESLLTEALLAFYANQGIQPLSLLYSLNCKLFPSVQFSSVAQSCPTLCNPMNRSTPSLPVHHQLPEFTQTRVHRVSDAIQPSYPLNPLLLLPPIPPSIKVFSKESTLCRRWPKYWSFSFTLFLPKKSKG